MGTLEYIAPEQIEGGPADGRSDQYALAGIAVACLSGKVPFPRDSDVALINAHLHDAPPSVHVRRPDLPPAVDGVIARGLAKVPDDRYRDCRAFVDELRSALGITATHTAARDQVMPDRRVLAAVAGLMVVAVLGVIAFGLLSGSGSLSDPSDGPSQAVASPSALVEASPTEDVFPNDAEEALLNELPGDLQGNCSRGPYGVIVGHSGGAAPLVSLECTPPSSSGASQVVVRRFRPPGGIGALVGGFISSIAGGAELSGGRGSLTGDGRQVGPGDCATEPRANGRWQLAGEDVGAIVCYTVASSGDAFLWWTYDSDAILVRAINQRGDSEALYDWFEQNARFITP